MLEAGAGKVGRLLVSAGDSTPPTITVSSPADGSSYPLGTAVLADYTCADEPGGSGVASCVGDLANGATVDTSSVGEQTFTVAAQDNAGNAARKTVSYRVLYEFAGFASPINNQDGNGNHVLNEVKAGSAIPVKFRLNGNQGLAIFEPGYPKSAAIPCDPTADIDGIEAASGLRWSYEAVQGGRCWLRHRRSALASGYAGGRGAAAGRPLR